jgi:hypothetical protein
MVLKIQDWHRIRNRAVVLVCGATRKEAKIQECLPLIPSVGSRRCRSSAPSIGEPSDDQGTSRCLVGIMSVEVNQTKARPRKGLAAAANAKDHKHEYAVVNGEKVSVGVVLCASLAQLYNSQRAKLPATQRA